MKLTDNQLKNLAVAVIKNALKDDEDYLKTEDGKFWSLCFTETDKKQQNKGMTDISQQSPTVSTFEYSDTQYPTHFITDEDIIGF